MAIALEPSVICVYGVSGIGKTTDLLYSFPNASIVAAPGALKPANWIGFVPKLASGINTLQDLVAALKRLKPKPVRGNCFPAIGVDDLSLLADATISGLEKNGKGGWLLWGEIRDLLLELRTQTRNLNCHVILTCHESDAKERSGRTQKVGPRLPGKMPEDFPTACDMVLRAVTATGERIGWKGAYRSLHTDEHYAKDRHNTAPDGSPMNLGELLRAAGFELPRLELYPWQEDAVAKLADSFEVMLRAGQKEELRQAAAQQVPAMLAAAHPNVPSGIYVWTIRDAIDRAVIRIWQSTAAFAIFQRAAVL